MEDKNEEKLRKYLEENLKLTADKRDKKGFWYKLIGPDKFNPLVADVAQKAGYKLDGIEDPSIFVKKGEERLKITNNQVHLTGLSRIVFG